MVLKTTILEQSISEATGKSVLMIRFYAARMIAEIEIGRHLSKQEISKLSSKVYNSLPRKNHGHEPIDKDSFPEIIRILQRAKLLVEEDEG